MIEQKEPCNQLPQEIKPAFKELVVCNILRCIRTQLAPGIPVQVLFVRHRTKKNEWLGVLFTDLALTADEIIQIYAIRWDIEVFFKCTNSLGNGLMSLELIPIRS